MTEWNCMDPDYPDRLCDYKDCEVECPYREAREKLEAVKTLFLPLPDWVEWEEGPMSIEASKMLKLKEILEGKVNV